MSIKKQLDEIAASVAATAASIAGIAGGTSADETTVTSSAVALSANTSGTLLAANASRIRFTIYNPLATTLYVRKAASAATASAGGYDIAVPSLGTYFGDAYEYAGEIRGICATAGNVAVSESV